MEVQLTPEMEAQLSRWTTQTGRSQADFVRDAMASYLEELEQGGSMLDARYDEVRSGAVKLIPGDEVRRHFEQKREERLRGR